MFEIIFNGNEVYGVVVLSNRRLASFSEDCSIKVWSLETGEILEDATDEQDCKIGGVKALPNDQLFVVPHVCVCCVTQL